MRHTQPVWHIYHGTVVLLTRSGESLNCPPSRDPAKGIPQHVLRRTGLDSSTLRVVALVSRDEVLAQELGLAFVALAVGAPSTDRGQRIGRRVVQLRSLHETAVAPYRRALAAPFTYKLVQPRQRFVCGVVALFYAALLDQLADGRRGR